MRTKAKKLTSVILAVVMMLGILTIAPLTVSAATYGDFEYTLEDDYTCTITKYNGSAATLNIPYIMAQLQLQDIPVQPNLLKFQVRLMEKW